MTAHDRATLSHRCLHARLHGARACCQRARRHRARPHGVLCGGRRPTRRQGRARDRRGGVCPIATTVYDADKTTIVHVPAEGACAPAPGKPCAPSLDWEHPPPLMRMHTALHLLCALVKFPVTGGQVGRRRRPARLRHRGRLGRRQGQADRRSQRADRRRSSGHRALDHRRRTRGQSAASCAPWPSSRRWAPARCASS